MDKSQIFALHDACVQAAQAYTAQCQQDDSEDTHEALTLKVNWLNAELDFNAAMNRQR